MSYEEGIKITDKAALERFNISPAKVAAATCSLFSELMLVHGFVHADPYVPFHSVLLFVNIYAHSVNYYFRHPGNILVRPRCFKDLGKKNSGEFDLVLLDHGMYRRLSEQFRWAYASLWESLIIGDTRKATDAVRHMGLEPHYVDLLGLILVYRLPVKVNSF